MSVTKQTRKKFAKPPVKVACLSCRASRIRCDGKETCSSCASKGKECCYLPSKRGGPRKKKIVQPSSLGMQMQHKSWTSTLTNPRVDEAVFNQFDSLAAPGAGLRHLDFSPEVQSMFEDLFVQASGNNARLAMNPEPVPIHIPEQEPPRVRVYGSEQDILNGYYVFIHQYFPIFPPTHSPIVTDRPLDSPGGTSDLKSPGTPLAYMPVSPVSLAISAVLALIPHPKDSEPTSPKSVLLRREYAERFSRVALESIEAESEFAESSANPSQALLNKAAIPNRLPIHPHTPVELECILALLILSAYEYAQRGNLVRMRNRAGQAYVMAMNMSLHALPPEDNMFSEARRRAWWMTGSIVSTTPPTIIANDPRFVTPYPRFASDPEGWSILLRAQHALLAATQFILDLNQTLKSKGQMHHIFERMKKLDGWIQPVLARANNPPSSPPPANDSEEVVAQSIRNISLIKLSRQVNDYARIKTHRFRAFLDIPIFIKKHCDLTCASMAYPDNHDPITESLASQPTSKLSCSCSSLYDIPSVLPAGQSPSSCSATSDTSGATTSTSWINEDAFPFTSYQSTEICLQSALTIAEMFHTLPYPSPIYEDGVDSSSRPLTPSDPSTMPQRTMPSFACCAMQSSYAMLMLYYKSRVMDQTGESEIADNPLRGAEEIAEELQHGLDCVIAAVRNYSAAFEALDGMRDEIEGAYLTAFPQS
ncbi:hypothetical protein FQN52_004107 [Onygenales sp. PD_12]|nr:hypothetical protein FQN52_004107 [Onygenales sp. PD_12]